MADSGADILRAYREELRYSQAQMAEFLGVSDRTLGSWERGATVPKSVLMLLQTLEFVPFERIKEIHHISQKFSGE